MTYPKGLDVSTYNALGGWDPAGLAFLVARASIGLRKDDKYDQHIAKAKAAALVTGAYHYNWDGSSPETQAQFFVKAAGDVDLYFADVEGNTAFTADETRRFIAEVQRLGKSCGLYMSASAYRWSVGQDYDWIAKWTAAEPSGDWEFWQYQGSPMDKDYFNGTIAQLKALAGNGASTPMSVYEKQDKKGTFKVTSGATAIGMKLTDTGFENTTKALTSGSGHYDGVYHKLSGTGPSYALRITDGALAGLYVNSAAVDETPDPAPVTFTQAQIDAAVASQKAADTADLAAKNAKIAELQTQLAGATDAAAKAERERIANVIAEAEANRVRTA